MSAKKKVCISGVFDCFHEGHLHLLREAAKLGDVFVLVDNDGAVRRRKGKGRPRDPQNVRVNNVLASDVVSWAAVNHDASPLNFIMGWKPDFLVVGNDYLAEEIVGLKEGAAWGCKALIVPRIKGISTTELLKKKKK